MAVQKISETMMPIGTSRCGFLASSAAMAWRRSASVLAAAMRSSWAFMVLRLASIFCTVGLTSAAGGVAAGLAGAAAGASACAAVSGWWASTAQAGWAKA